ncbi:hypothetical protein M8J77_022086 [Diaphorina citri]|nr:hypothetical protein M8J77_022086 [Diaphorina citri]
MAGPCFAVRKSYLLNQPNRCEVANVSPGQFHVVVVRTGPASGQGPRFGSRFPRLKCSGWTRRPWGQTGGLFPRPGGYFAP